ncbi:MAG: ABC transporter substrate-binding protein, partial [Aggregatilineales bacterium]
ALQEQQDKLLDVFETLSEDTSAVNVVVSTPVPTPVLTASETVLKFHVYDIISPIPNREEWETLLMDFTANDPEVGFVELSTGFSQQAADEETLDCYYRSSNIVPSIDLTTILPLDPFLAADINFDESEILPGVMQQVRREGQTWALPLSIQPMMLWYNSTIFEEAGAFPPYSGWTTADFEDALRQIELSNGEEPFQPRQDNTYVMMLAAAYGGNPIDYSTDPPAYNLTDLTVVEAFREVLNLAKDGYIKYEKLSNFGGGGFGGSGDTTPLYETFLSSLDWRFSNRDNVPSDVEDPYKLVSFPRGLEFSPAAFDLGTGYINANTLNPEACYRLLSYVSESTALFNAMPVRPNMIDTVADSDDVKAVYQEMAALLSQPDVINIPTPFTSNGGFGSFIMQMWMNRAFDSYVLDNADLDTVLIDAQGYIEDYTECIASIDEVPNDELRNMPPDESRDYFNQFNNCAIQVDPAMEETLRPMMGSNDDED